jgi:hypothetical protein
VSDPESPARKLVQVLVPVIATLTSTTMLLAAIVSPFLLFLSLGMQPCAPESWPWFLAKAAVPVTLLVGAIWLGRLKWRPDGRNFLIALAIPAAALLLLWILAPLEVEHQQRCEKQVQAR